MSSITVILLLFFSAGANALELPANTTGDIHNSMDISINKFVNRAIETWHLRYADLDSATLGKSASLPFQSATQPCGLLAFGPHYLAAQPPISPVSRRSNLLSPPMASLRKESLRPSKPLLPKRRTRKNQLRNILSSEESKQHTTEEQASNLGERLFQPHQVDMYDMFKNYGTKGDSKGDIFPDMVHAFATEVEKRSIKHFHDLDTCPSLVLNADYQPLSYMPLSLWSWQETMKAVLLNKVTVVEYYDHVMVRAGNKEFALPSVIALKEYIRPDLKSATFTRRNLYLRDHYRCAYCAQRCYRDHLTFDHLVPVAKGGMTTWENIVSCCKRCNVKKGKVHPSKLHTIGMRLQYKPVRPTWYQLQQLARKYPPGLRHSTWDTYLSYDKSNYDKSKSAIPDPTT